MLCRQDDDLDGKSRPAAHPQGRVPVGHMRASPLSQALCRPRRSAARTRPFCRMLLRADVAGYC